MKLRPLSKARAMPYVYQEYPKWIAGPEVIVQNAAEERCIRRQWSRDIGQAKANAVQRSRADALALELARGSEYTPFSPGAPDRRLFSGWLYHASPE
jgi:hypothetical protein